jgi:hypothetical protein
VIKSSDSGILKLVKMKNLRYLTISGNSTTNKIIKKFNQIRPDVELDN